MSSFINQRHTLLVNDAGTNTCTFPLIHTHTHTHTQTHTRTQQRPLMSNPPLRSANSDSRESSYWLAVIAVAISAPPDKRIRPVLSAVGVWILYQAGRDSLPSCQEHKQGSWWTQTTLTLTVDVSVMHYPQYIRSTVDCKKYCYYWYLYYYCYYCYYYHYYFFYYYYYYHCYYYYTITTNTTYSIL